MNKYLAFYNGNKVEIEANSLYEAKLTAIDKLKPKRKQEHMITVVLVEAAGRGVVHNADF